MEDYLRVIFELEKERSEVKSVDIAKKLKISKASVSEMIRKIARKKLISIKPYSKLRLTSKGREKAERLYKKHAVIRGFMSKLLKDEAQAEEEAHKLEHAFSFDSAEVLNKILVA